MKCINCGCENEENAKFCQNCGSSMQNNNACENQNNTQYSYYPQEEQKPNDNGGLGWGLLGCCVPVAGLVLFLVWKDTKPKTAKAAGIGALVSVGITILSQILVACAGVMAGMI